MRVHTHTHTPCTWNNANFHLMQMKVEWFSASSPLKRCCRTNFYFILVRIICFPFTLGETFFFYFCVSFKIRICSKVQVKCTFITSFNSCDALLFVQFSSTLWWFSRFYSLEYMRKSVICLLPLQKWMHLSVWTKTNIFFFCFLIFLHFFPTWNKK